MRNQKYKLALLFFIFFLFFVGSNGRPEPLLLFFFLSIVILWRLETYWEHRFLVPLPSLFWGSLLFIAILFLLPLFSLYIVFPAFVLFYGFIYTLLLLVNRFLLIRQKVPGNFILWGMGTLVVICGACSWLFCISARHSFLWGICCLFLIPLTIEFYLFLWKPNRLDGKKLPLLLSSFLPYSLIKTHSFYCESHCFSSQPDAELFIHVADTKYGKLGHTDLYFDHQVIAFGGYDVTSQKLDGMFGEGMIFFAPDKEKYLNFCRSYSKKTIFSFGIRLSEEQKQQLRSNIQMVKQQTVPWIPPADASSAYAYHLQQSTGAAFYKFTHGPWKTYFILRNNCTLFCNFLLRFLDFAPSYRILTPGFYYMCLQNRWKRGDSRLVSKKIYPYKGESAWDTASYTIPEKQ